MNIPTRLDTSITAIVVAIALNDIAAIRTFVRGCKAMGITIPADIRDQAEIMMRDDSRQTVDAVYADEIRTRLIMRG